MGPESGYQPRETLNIDTVLGEYSLGQTVRVERSDGSVEDGWTVKGVEEHDGLYFIVVERPADEGIILKKKVTKEELNAVNLHDSLSQATEVPVQQREFKMGDKVRVQRTSGEIEEGWVVLYTEQNNGREIVTVLKSVPGAKSLAKSIPYNELLELNS